MKEILKVLEMLEFSDDWSGIIAIAAYVLEAWALYTIAERRGISKPWLAWIPVVNVWTLGSISDQYHYVTKREVKNKRKLLLGLSIALFAVAIVFVAVLIALILNLVYISGSAFAEILPGTDFSDMEFLLDPLVNNAGQIFLLIGLTIPLIGLAITSAVYRWIALYDLFRSCEPSNATVYLVVSLIGGFVVEGVYTVFMMICRGKDLGMPPRKPETVPVVETQPEEPWVQE